MLVILLNPCSLVSCDLSSQKLVKVNCDNDKICARRKESLSGLKAKQSYERHNELLLHVEWVEPVAMVTSELARIGSLETFEMTSSLGLQVSCM